jgi:DHA1 family inner membrane transport protein
MWLRILILALGTFALGTDGFVIAGILPDVAKDLNVSVATAGLTVTVFSLTYALGAPVLATIAGNVERKKLLLGSLAVFVLANVLAAIAAHLGILLLARVLAACGAALYTPTAAAAAAMIAPLEKRGRALSLVTAGLTVSTVLGVPLGIVISEQLNWQATFMLVALLGVVAFVGVLALFPAVVNPPTVTLRTRLALLRKPSVVALLLNIVIWLAAVQVVFTYFSVILEQVTHLQGNAISGMFFLFGLAGVVGNIVGGYAADRWGPVRTLIGGLSGVIVALFMLPLVGQTVIGMALVSVFWGVAGWMLMPPQQHRLISLSESMPSVVLSLNSSAIYLGIASGAALGGLVLNVAPASMLAWVGGSLEAAALALLLVSVWVSYRVRRRAPQTCNRQSECIAAS